jgi:hypothetical protein
MDPRLRSQRNENSVLFSLDSLSSAAESPRVSNTGGAEGSGLIDISAMLGGGSSSSSSSGNDSFGGPIGLAPSAPAPMAGAPLPSLVNRKKNNTGLIVGIVAGAVIIAGGIVAAVVLKGGDKPTEPVVANNTPAVVAVGETPKSAAPVTQPPSAAAVASAAVSEPPSAAAPVSVAANDAAGKPGGAGRPAGGGGGPRVAAGGGRPGGGDEDTPSVAAPRPASPTPAAPQTDAPKPQKKGGGEDVDDILGALDGKGSAKPAGGGGKPAAAARRPSDDPMLPEQLTKPQILGVVKKAASQISNCKERDPNASGTVMVSIQIEKSGRVGKASAKGPFAGTPVGNCVESTVRTFQFPQFSGDQMTINMPFAL